MLLGRGKTVWHLRGWVGILPEIKGRKMVAPILAPVIVGVGVEDRMSPNRRFRGVVGTADVEADIDSAAAIYDNVWIKTQGQTRFSTV